MHKVKIEALGEPKTIQGQKGPFQVFGIKVNGVWMNGYYNEVTSKWTVGQDVEITITDKAGKDGKMYKNFSLPKTVDVQADRIMKLESRVTTLELSFERKFAELAAKVKSDVVLDTTGKFLTGKDYEKYTAPHPFLQSSNPLDGMPPEDEPPF